MTELNLALAFWLGGVAFFLIRAAYRSAFLGIDPAPSVSLAAVVLFWPLAALASPLICLAPRRLVDAAIVHARQAGVRGLDVRPSAVDCVVVSVMPSPDAADAFFVGSTAHKAGMAPICTPLEQVKADQISETVNRIVSEGMAGLDATTRGTDE